MDEQLPRFEHGVAWIPVSIGELIDKLTILELKCKYLGGEPLTHVQLEQGLLQTVLAGQSVAVDPQLHAALEAVNGALWEVEEQLRACERQGEFGADFVQLARRVYQLNDNRHSLKQRINISCGTGLIEQKSYG